MDIDRSYFSESTLDDLMREVIAEILQRGNSTSPSKGDNREITAVLLELSDPRARLSRTESRGKPFSSLGELFWYLSGSNDAKFIEYYISEYKNYNENGVIHGGYGPRLFNWKNRNQWSSIENLLITKPTTRRAVIQLFDSEDLAVGHKDIPCTCTLQFLLRNDHLHLHTSMRSNDVIIGLPHDIFCFSMLQEIMSKTINAKLGKYTHAVGSMHLYDCHIDKAKAFLNEGYQSTNNSMPEMPPQPWKHIPEVLEIERKIRCSKSLPAISTDSLPQYWADLARMLTVFRLSKDGRKGEIPAVRKKMHSDVFNVYIEQKSSNPLGSTR